MFFSEKPTAPPVIRAPISLTSCTTIWGLAWKPKSRTSVDSKSPRRTKTKERSKRLPCETSLTAPYMHDGSQQTLEEVVEWYAKGGHPNDHLSDKIKKLDLTDQDKADLVAFMTEGLTSDFPPVEQGRLP